MSEADLENFHKLSPTFVKIIKQFLCQGLASNCASTTCYLLGDIFNNSFYKFVNLFVSFYLLTI